MYEFVQILCFHVQLSRDLKPGKVRAHQGSNRNDPFPHETLQTNHVGRGYLEMMESCHLSISQGNAVASIFLRVVHIFFPLQHIVSVGSITVTFALTPIALVAVDCVYISTPIPKKKKKKRRLGSSYRHLESAEGRDRKRDGKIRFCTCSDIHHKKKKKKTLPCVIHCPATLKCLNIHLCGQELGTSKTPPRPHSHRSKAPEFQRPASTTNAPSPGFTGHYWLTTCARCYSNVTPTTPVSAHQIRFQFPVGALALRVLYTILCFYGHLTRILGPQVRHKTACLIPTQLMQRIRSGLQYVYDHG